MTTTASAVKKRYRLLHGLHCQSEPVEKDATPYSHPCPDCSGLDEDGKTYGTGKVGSAHREGRFDCPACKGTGIKHVEVVYNAKKNNIVVSVVNLEERFGEKFLDMDRVAGTDAQQDSALQARIAQLEAENRKLAKDNEDLSRDNAALNEELGPYEDE